MAKIPVIKPEQIIDIQVNGSFFTRVQVLLMYLLEGREPKETIEIMNDVAANNIKSPIHAHVQTVSALLSEIESQARNSGFIEEIDFEPNLDDNA
jgi:hypothetical protein